MDVTIYTTSRCPYCSMAKRLFEEQNIEYKEIDIEAENISSKELEKISKSSEVPQILIDGTAIGGYDELLEYYQSGKLISDQLEE